MIKIKQIACNGSQDSNSKHPSVYLKLHDTKETICPYCSKKFTISKRNNKHYIEVLEVNLSNKTV